MGSTYLDLTNRVLRRLNEVEIDSSSFASVRGVQAAAKDAVLDTIREINSQKFEWPFNSASGTQVLTIGTSEYTWPADFRIPDWDSFTLYNDGTLNTATTKLCHVTREEYDKYARPNDLDHTTLGIGKPVQVYETWSGGFGVTPVPDHAYTVKFKYWIKTITMSAYSDATTIPTEYDQVITDGAMWKMFMFMDNPERAGKAQADYREGLGYMAYTLIPKEPYAWFGFRPDTGVNKTVGIFTYN